MIFHLLRPSQWEDVKGTRGATLAGPGPQGFVHCCEERQIPGVIERWFGGGPVVIVALEPGLVGAEIRYEGDNERFPHVYGPIPLDAVVDVRPPR